MVDENVYGRLALVVSDDEATVEHVRDLLTVEGFEVYAADSSMEADLFCRSRQPRIAVVDVEMASGDGFEAITVVRRATRDSFIIATTRGKDNRWWPMVSLVSGADQYIAGPLGPQDLDAPIRAVRQHFAWQNNQQYAN